MNTSAKEKMAATMNIVNRIIEENRGREQHVALSEGDDSMTYGELFDTVADWRNILAQAGVHRFDRVAFLCEDSIDYVCLSLSVLAAGAVLAPISPSLSRNETTPTMEGIDAAWLLYDDAIPTDNKGRLLTGPTRRRVFRLAPRTTRGTTDTLFSACDPAFVRFSSGTTGASKGVVLSHQAILERTDAADRGLRIVETDRILWVLSMSFHFVVTILLFLRRGACIVLCGHDFPGELTRQLAAGTATFIYASPVHYKLIAGSKDFDAGMFAPIRMAVSTAMPLASDIASRFETRFGQPLCQAYGIIEVGLAFIQTPDAPRKPGSVGRIGEGYEIKLATPDHDGVGEVLLRGKGMFSAYFSPWRTRAQIDPEGWFHTGDLGRLDRDGDLFLIGRKREAINFAGMKIFPTEVESVLNRHASVRESRVYGEPHNYYGQWPVAQIVPADTRFDERTLRRFCYANLAPHQVPKRFEPVAAIAKTASGKIKRIRA